MKKNDYINEFNLGQGAMLFMTIALILTFIKDNLGISGYYLFCMLFVRDDPIQQVL